jgi:maleylacetoacetate isomerase
MAGDGDDSLLLYGAATSSCSFRVRIALNLLGSVYKSEVVDAPKRSSAEFLQVNPQGLVPLLVHGSRRIGQSIAILEYLHDVFGIVAETKLLPEDPLEKARVRALALYVCCEIQPIQNTRLDTSLAEAVSPAELMYLCPAILIKD